MCLGDLGGRVKRFLRVWENFYGREEGRGKGGALAGGEVARSTRERSAREGGLTRAGVVLARSPASLAKLFAFSKVICLRRGRRVLLGAAAPRSTPFQPPPATPLGFPGGHCSHGSVGSWEEPTRTTPARKGRYEALSVEPRPARRWVVLSRAASGDELRANGALGAGGSREGQGSILGLLPYIKGWKSLGAAVRVVRSGNAGQRSR